MAKNKKLIQRAGWQISGLILAQIKLEERYNKKRLKLFKKQLLSVKECDGGTFIQEPLIYADDKTLSYADVHELTQENLQKQYDTCRKGS